MQQALVRLTLTAAVAAAVLLLGPESWRTLARGFLVPWTPAEAIVPARSVAVEPGNRTVPRGSSLDIEATANGYSPSEALLLFRTETEAEWHPCYGAVPWFEEQDCKFAQHRYSAEPGQPGAVCDWIIPFNEVVEFNFVLQSVRCCCTQYGGE